MNSSRAYNTIIAIVVLLAILTSCNASDNSTNPTISPAPPSGPINLSAVGDNGIVILTWESVSGATAYNVYRGTSVGPIVNKIKIATGLTSTSYNDPMVTNGTIYYYQVTALNGNGESGGSNEVKAMPQVTLPPAAPLGLSAHAAKGLVKLSWTAESGATSYNVYRGISSGVLSTKTKIISEVTSTSYNDSSCVNGTTYYYQVTAVNTNGESVGSDEVGTRIIVTPVPGTGAGEDGAFSIPLSYTDNNDGTVKDNRTGLLWQKCTNGLSGADCSTGPAEVYNWYVASGTFDTINNPSSESVCSSLNLLGGGWRLPTDFELMTIVNYGTSMPAISTAFFPNTQSDPDHAYWSTSIYLGAIDGSGAWNVNFGYGYVTGASKGYDFYVRCVR